MPLFELRDVTRRYGERTVLDVPELTLMGDRVYAIVGPSGAGKTTLLRILNLLDPPDSGQVRFMGQETAGNERRRLEMMRTMCMVFQKPYMFRTTVFNNVAYGLRLRSLTPAEIRSRVMEALEFVGMQDFAHHPATRLSGGEGQRVAVARALAIRPQVLLLDEPTANLDPANVAHIERIVRQGADRYGTSVLLVTHNLFQAKRIADETLLMVDGRIIEHQPTADFFAHPRDARTQAFLTGTMVY